MREYIKPQTEIVTSDMPIMAAGMSGLNTEVGDGEFANTTDFESDLQQVEKKSLWED
jgi:hypothetical protein